MRRAVLEGQDDGIGRIGLGQGMRIDIRVFSLGNDLVEFLPGLGNFHLVGRSGIRAEVFDCDGIGGGIWFRLGNGRSIFLAGRKQQPCQKHSAQAGNSLPFPLQSFASEAFFSTENTHGSYGSIFFIRTIYLLTFLRPRPCVHAPSSLFARLHPVLGPVARVHLPAKVSQGSASPT